MSGACAKCGAWTGSRAAEYCASCWKSRETPAPDRDAKVAAVVAAARAFALLATSIPNDRFSVSRHDIEDLREALAALDGEVAGG